MNFAIIQMLVRRHLDAVLRHRYLARRRRREAGTQSDGHGESLHIQVSRADGAYGHGLSAVTLWATPRESFTVMSADTDRGGFVHLNLGWNLNVPIDPPRMRMLPN